jgi:hypothetical protein
VLDYTQKTFIFGYAIAAASVIDTLTKFALKHPGLAIGITTLTGIFSAVSPLVLTAVKYIVVGGTLFLLFLLFRLRFSISDLDLVSNSVLDLD